MQGINFLEQTMLLKRPHMTAAECYDLPVFRDDKEVISCWKMSFRERLRVLVTGVVWLRVLGRSHPPLALEVKCPFRREADDK